MAINVTLVAAGLAYGLWKTADARHRPEGARALVLVAVAFLLSFFPMILMTHISEIYLTAATFALALLAGLSVRGWRAAPRPLRSVAAILAIAQLLLGVGAIQAKVARMNRVGERSESMARGLLEFIPDDGAPKRVAVVFPEHTAADPLSYSVFMIPDDQLLLPGYGRWVVRFFRPGQEIAVDQIKVAELGGLDHGSYDVVVRWDGAIGRFLPVPGSGRESR